MPISKEEYHKFLEECVINESLEGVKKYINESNVNDIPDSDYMTPLWQAVRETDKLEIIEYLLSIGANPNIPKMEGGYCILTSEIIDSMDLYSNGITKEPKIGKIKLLVKYGADINKISNKDNKWVATPLDKSIGIEHYNAEKYLRSIGAKRSTLYLLSNYLYSQSDDVFLLINKEDFLKEKPYFEELEACSGSIIHYDILRIIYFNKNEEKESELEKIIVFRMRKDVQEKVKSNINDLDKKGRTPLDFALELGFKNAYDVFRKYGGKTSKELQKGK